jgi:hypothetical protein
MSTMFSPAGATGRVSFLFGLMAINSVGLLAWLGTLAMRPTGTSHWFVIGLFALIFWVWTALHARRLGDGRKPRAIAYAAGIGLFVAFMIGYLILASLWAQPEVQREAFRTGGTTLTMAPETSWLMMSLGHFLVGWLGAAASLALAGLAAIGMFLVGTMSLIFSFLCLLPGSRSALPLPSFKAVRLFNRG